MAVDDRQSYLWQQRNNQQLFAELCNALYERELSRLSQEKQLSLTELQKRIASLPYYIKRAAEHISELYTPLDLDSQNGSWITNQATKPHSLKHQAEKCAEFYQQHGKMALVVPIAVNHYGIENIVLDTIDEIDVVSATLHCNQHGYFHFSGAAKEESTVNQKTLLKPSKPIMAAACCGHQWLNVKRTSPRLLSLREMLLASRINWRSFSKLLPIKGR